MASSKLFLIPVPISENVDVIPRHSIDIISNCSVFICERVRTSRRFIKAILKDFNIDESTFIELEKKGDVSEHHELREVWKSGKNACFMSEAGSPCIADPGSKVVNLARQNGYQIVPCSGPSSLMAALMASGLDGQHFSFRGYLPVKRPELQRELKKIEQTISKTGYTQIFIETPYRNMQLFESLINSLNQEFQLCIALGIHSPQESINTKPIRRWKKDSNIKNHLKEKVPCIFLLGR